MRTRRNEYARRWRAGLIGIVALALVAVVVYIAYNALGGLPFQSRYHVTVVLPDADHLIPADDVKIAGVRVGQVSAVQATPATASRPPAATLRLSLDTSVGRLPADSGVRVRWASPLGATYLEIDPGRSAVTIPDGGTLQPVRRPATTDLVDLYAIFDRSARRSFQNGVQDLSGGLAGRGSSLNTTMGSLSALLPPLTDVSGVLAAPPARLGRFIQVYTHLADALAPIATQLAGVAANGADTMGALASERGALGDAIQLAPGVEGAATNALRAARPGLDRLTRLSAALNAATRPLPAALAAVDTTLRAGTPVLRGSRPLTGPLRTSLAAITAVAREQPTDGAVRKLTDVFATTDDVLAALLPAQTQCNLIPLFFQRFASYIGMVGFGNGPAMINVAVDRPGARTDEIQSAAPSPDLHLNYLPHEDTSECEAGNEPFDGSKQEFGNPPGLQSAHTRESSPPPHVLDLARSAGLLATGPGR